MFLITTAATNKNLATREDVKTDLDISGAAEDAKIDRLIARVSAMICSYLNVPVANDGSVTLAEETISETFQNSPWLGNRRSRLILARKPVTQIISVGIGATTIEAADYELDGAAGMLIRTGDRSIPGFATSPGSRTAIAYKAGWTLPGVADYTLPRDIEAAAIGLIRSARFSAQRDPAVKAEETTDISRVEYWVGQIGQNGAFPPDIASMLDPYCYEPTV